ncbi:MAG: hypothetical protein ABIK79_08110 [Chloroflexota bacterium]
MWERKGLLRRLSSNPILEPIAAHPWELKLVYNAAAFRIGATIYLLYRGLGDEHISRLGLAWTQDGTHVAGRLPYPVFEPKEDYELPSEETRKARPREKGGCEDSRATIIGDRIYIVYTAYGELCQIALASIKVARFLKLVETSAEGSWSQEAAKQAWTRAWTRHGLVFPQLPTQGVFSRNACVFPIWTGTQIMGYGLIYRIGRGPIKISYTPSPLGPWSEGEVLMGPEQPWERERMGICTPPIRTTYGQLFFYHGVEPTGQGGRIYRLGCFFARFSGDERGAITHTIARSSQPVLSPKRDYERRSEWLEPLHVYAVFSCGAVPLADKMICEGDDEILLYYSGGDSRLCVAAARVSELARLVWGDTW